MKLAVVAGLELINSCIASDHKKGHNHRIYLGEAKFDELDFWSISNWNFAGYTGKFKLGKKMKFIKLHS